jgi:hypothetical protein
VKKAVKTMMALALAVTCVVGSHSTAAYAFNNTSGTVKWSDGSKMYSTIYVGVGNPFNVQSGTFFTRAGSKKTTQIKNTLTVSITGIGVSISGLSGSTGSSSTSASITNTKGQNYAGISGSCQSSNLLYLYITGSSSGSAIYDGSAKVTSTVTTKWY